VSPLTPPRSSSSPKEPVSPERILETAARLIELDGVEAFTMRRLAEQLGVA
jgi:AcrR family transcriptional regulator